MSASCSAPWNPCVDAGEWKAIRLGKLLEKIMISRALQARDENQAQGHGRQRPALVASQQAFGFQAAQYLFAIQLLGAQARLDVDALHHEGEAAPCTQKFTDASKKTCMSSSSAPAPPRASMSRMRRWRVPRRSPGRSGPIPGFRPPDLSLELEIDMTARRNSVESETKAMDAKAVGKRPCR